MNKFIDFILQNFKKELLVLGLLGIVSSCTSLIMNYSLKYAVDYAFGREGTRLWIAVTWFLIMAISTFLCNGVELKEISEEFLINGYAYLPQDFPILDLTIRENFQLAAPGKEDRFYEDYLKKANLFETVMALPEGMDTKVNAKTISTGQRQRLALCGILMRDTAYVVLDEPISNLDGANIEDIRRLLESMDKKYIVITHDKRILLKDAQIEQIG